MKILESALRVVAPHAFVRQILVIVVCLLSVFIAWNTFISVDYSLTKDYVMDDSFITFHYARNLMNEKNLLWNVGDQFATEGYSSIVWVLLCSFFYSIGVDLVIASKVMSIFLMVSVPVMIFTYFKESLFLGPFYFVTIFLIPFLFFANPDVILHLQSGMETALAISLSTAFFIMVTKVSIEVNGGVPSAGKLLATSVLGLLCSLNRPEFNLVFMVSSFIIVMQSRGLSRHVLNWLVVPYLCIGIIYMIWRLYCYGPLLPLPFYIKTSAGFLAGRPDVISFLVAISPLILFATVANKLQRIGRVMLPLIFGIASLCLFFVFPAHIMGDAHRFLFPLYGGFCFIFFFMAINCDTNRLNFLVKFIVLAGVFFVIYGVRVMGDQGVVSSMVWYAQGLNSAHIRIGKALSEFSGTIAIGDAGAIPYYSNWHTIDTFGLNDKAIALARSNSFFKSYDVNLVMSRSPDLIVLISSSCGDVVSPQSLDHEAVIFKAAFSKSYKPIGSVKFQDNYYLYLMGKDTKLINKVKSKLIADGIIGNCTWPYAN